MKLWLCSASSIDCEPTALHVAETEEEALEKFEKTLEEDGIWYGSLYADVVENIDGYTIKVIPVKP